MGMNRATGRIVPRKLNKRVLLVIHGRPRSALRSALEDRGVDVVAVRSIDEARLWLKQTTFNLLLFDSEGDADSRQSI